MTGKLMKFQNRQIYSDSDFFPDEPVPDLPETVDLTNVTIYSMQGLAMVRLCDLEQLLAKLGITVVH
jgi:hypothetical protein